MTGYKSELQPERLSGSTRIHHANILSVTFFLIITFFAAESFSQQGELAFDSKIKAIYCKDINDNTVIIPIKEKINILLFFNINKISHQKLVSKFNFVIKNLVEQEKKVNLIYISKGEPKKFLSLVERYNIKFSFINDVGEKFFSFFDFSCGECNKIIIIDKEGKLRYNASYIDFYFVTSIIDRYESQDKGGKR